MNLKIFDAFEQMVVLPLVLQPVVVLPLVLRPVVVRHRISYVRIRLFLEGIRPTTDSNSDRPDSN
jgi:hypothetical protein